MILRPAIAAVVAFVIISVMKTLLGGLGRERQGGNIRSGGRAGHDVCKDGEAPMKIQMPFVKTLVRWKLMQVGDDKEQ